MYQQHRFNFFEQIAYAVVRPMQYYRLTKVSGSRFTGFVFLLILLISIFSTIRVSYTMFGPNGVLQYLNQDIPEFDLSGGSLYVSERVEETNANTYILIDTNVYAFSTNDIDESYNQVLLISQTNLISYQPYGRIQEIKFSDLNGLHLDNSIINRLLPFFYLLLVMIILFIYILRVGLYFLSALLYSLVGLIISSACHANLTYATIFKTAIYSKVTICLLFGILSLTTLAIPGPARIALALLVTCLYNIFGILSHTSRDAYEEAGILPPGNNY